MSKKLNPWKISTLTPQKYRYIKKNYSLGDMNFKLKDNPTFIKRDLIMGQDNFENWLLNAKSGKKVALVSGFMTSGFLHLGSLTVLKQMVYYQKNYHTDIFIPLADLEARCVRKTPVSKIKKILTEFLAHFFAAGLDIKKTKIYLQTKNVDVLKKAGLFTGKIDINNLEKVYDRKLSLGEAYSSLVMAADILLPQEKGYVATLINLGVDEISHFILVKELIPLLGEEFHLPSITYNKILTGLNGSKMGKSLPENSILLSEPITLAIKKLENLKNKPLELYENTAFNILEWYSDDDALISHINKISDKSKANDLAVDEACKVVNVLLTEHQKAYKKYLPYARKLCNQLIINGKNY